MFTEKDVMDYMKSENYTSYVFDDGYIEFYLSSDINGNLCNRDDDLDTTFTSVYYPWVDSIEGFKRDFFRESNKTFEYIVKEMTAELNALMEKYND